MKIASKIESHIVGICRNASETDFSRKLTLRIYSGNDREHDLRAYEGKQLRMYQETPFFAFFHICEVMEDIFCLQSMILLFLSRKTSFKIDGQT